MKQMILTDTALESLRRNVPKSFEEGLYSTGSSWVETEFESIPFRETNVTLPRKPPVLKVTGKGTDESKNDLENSKAFFSAYSGLTYQQATSEAFWAYLTHVQYWDYTLQRWPVSTKKDKQVQFIKERYFLKGNSTRGLVRNSLSRLWWFSKLTFDEGAENPFHLTKILLSLQDIAQSLLERSWGRNNNIVRSCLEFIDEHPELMSGNRDKTRFLIKSVTLEGGVCIIDMLSSDDIKAFLKGRYEAWDKKEAAKTQPVA